MKHHPLRLLALALLVGPITSHATAFAVTNLVTDDQTANPAQITDTDLVNAWGMAASATSPFWVSDNGTGVSTLYRVDPLTNATVKVGLTVTIPGAGNVTGQAFNSLTAGNFNGDTFLFVSEDGTVSGWRGALGTSAETLQIGSPDNLYKGVAFATVAGSAYLYAADFLSGQIDVLKGNAGAPDLAGSFTDPNLPAGYAPFNVQNIGGNLYVTYALRDANGPDDVPGLGNGFVDVFDLQGGFLARLATQGALNSPWGMALAPASFEQFAGDLLVGNFGDGRINIFDLATQCLSRSTERRERKSAGDQRAVGPDGGQRRRSRKPAVDLFRGRPERRDAWSVRSDFEGARARHARTARYRPCGSRGDSTTQGVTPAQIEFTRRGPPRSPARRPAPRMPGSARSRACRRRSQTA